MQLGGSWLALASVLGLTATSCTREANPNLQVEPVEVLVDDENHAPLPNASVLSAGGEVLSSTGEDGVAHMQVGGPEGTSNELTLHCPDGYSADQPKMIIKKMTMNAVNGATRYTMYCRRLVHTLVIAIRTDETVSRKKSVPLVGLPITYLGQPKAVTDSSGAATLTAQGAEGQTFEFTVMTNQPDNATLNPQNFSQTFRIASHDQVVAFTPTFSRPQKKVVVHHVVKRGPIAF